jgi:hypothetical protein
MSTYTIRGLRTGILFGDHLSPTEAAALVLRHATRRFTIHRTDEGYYQLCVQIRRGIMSVAYSHGRVIGAHAITKEVAWEVIALQILETEWPGIGIWPDDKPSLRVVWDKHHAAQRELAVNAPLRLPPKRQKSSATANDEST